MPACSKTDKVNYLWQILQCETPLLHLQTIKDCHRNLAVLTWPSSSESVGHSTVTRERRHSSEAGLVNKHLFSTVLPTVALIRGFQAAFSRLVHHLGCHDARKGLLWTKDRYKLGTGKWLALVATSRSSNKPLGGTL